MKYVIERHTDKKTYYERSTWKGDYWTSEIEAAQPFDSTKEAEDFRDYMGLKGHVTAKG